MDLLYRSIAFLLYRSPPCRACWSARRRRSRWCCLPAWTATKPKSSHSAGISCRSGGRSVHVTRMLGALSCPNMYGRARCVPCMLCCST